MSSRQSILIVDDKPANLIALEQTLDELDVHVVQASGGNEALVATLDREFALAILDVQMPEMDGFELAALLRGDARTRHIPIIFLTAAYGSEDKVFAGYAAGAVDYIVKPYRAPVLLAKVGVFLELAQARDELDKQRQAQEELVAARTRDLRVSVIEARQTADALAASERRFRAFFENAPEYCYMVSPAGITLDANRAALVALGRSRDEVVGRPIADVYAPECQPQLVQLRDAGQRIGPLRDLELEIITKEGLRRTVLLSVSVVRDDGGEILHAIAVQRDITDRKRRRERERLAREVLEILNRQDTAADVVPEILDAIWRETGFNAVALRLAEGDDFPYYRALGFPEAFLQQENRLCALDGAGELARPADGQPVLACLCGRVVSGRIDVHDPHFTAGGSFWTNDTSGLVAAADTADRLGPLRGTCHRFGYQSVALVPLRSGAERIGLLQLNDKRPGRFTLELIEFFESLGASIAVALDRHAAERALASSQAQLQQAQKMEAIGRLAGGVAHDFNNLLCIIQANCDFLKEELDPAGPAIEMVDEIDSAGRRAVALTRQLLAFSRKQLLAPRVLQINDLVSDMVKMLGRIVGEDVTIRLNLCDNGGLVRADPGQLEQVILNLAVNARDAMPDGGEVLIETANVQLDASHLSRRPGATAGPHVLITVRDTGCGMDAATKARLFEPFFTTKEVGKGTGLGLSTVFGIVKQSDGYIWVDSEPGQGATFQVYLPRLDQDEQPWRPRPVAAAAGGGGETILVVEDDDAVRALAVRALGKNGYTLLQANGLRQTLAVLAQCDRIDLLLSDVVMPGGSGPEVAAAVSAAHPDARVMYMSGHMDDAIARHKVLEPGVAFLQKPFTSLDLCGRVREVLDGA